MVHVIIKILKKGGKKQKYINLDYFNKKRAFGSETDKTKITGKEESLSHQTIVSELISKYKQSMVILLCH